MLTELVPVKTGPADEYVRIRVRQNKTFHFFNLDLEIDSMETIQPLVQELGDKVLPGYCENMDKQAILNLINADLNGVSFEESYDDENELVGAVDAHLKEFCSLIENLSEQSRRIWNNCYRKEFDVAFRAGNTPHTYQTRIEAETIKRCARIDATVLITVYPHMNYEYHKKDFAEK